jgi:hypothetical protein
MITKQGYVFIAELTNGATPLFGKPITTEQIKRGYENITSNEITPYVQEKNMREGMNLYGQNREGVRKLTPAQIDLRLAESKEELEVFRNLTDLVAIMKIEEAGYTDMRIYGPINKKFMDLYHGVIPAHRIDQNGLLTFKRSKYGDRTFEVAMEARYQLQRQSDNTPTTIGTFKLKRLK